MPKYNEKLKSTAYDPMDALALSQSAVLAGSAKGMNFDSAEDAIVFFARELDQVKARTYDIEYPELTALRLFPIESSVSDGVDTITYYSYGKTGFAKVISDYSDDLPRADVFGKPYQALIKSLGVSYAYSLQDIRGSRYAGKSLDVRKAESARKAVDTLVNRIAWAGDVEHGLNGLLTSGNNVPVWTPPAVTGLDGNTTTRFNNMTPDQILATINNALAYQSALTKGVERPNTIVFDETNYVYLQGTPRSTQSDTTILGWLKNNFPDIKFERASELVGGNPVNPYGDQNLMVIFNNSPDKFTLEIPMMFNQLPVQPHNLEFRIACEARVAGVIIYYPLSILIVPGV